MMDNRRAQEDGWNLRHTYAQLPDKFYSLQNPVPVADPNLVVFNEGLAEALGLNLRGLKAKGMAQVLAGNVLPDGSKPLAQAYAGHQFGNFTMLGDGRAILLGEQVMPAGELVDIQLKGAGKTVFSRRGDGRGTLKSMLREYLISEAMFGLGIPSSRSLAVVATGEPVYREQVYHGAVLTRIAKSHIRVGTFEFARQYLSEEDQRHLLDYTIDRHYPHCKEAENPVLAFFKEVMFRQATLMAEWWRVGFIHGVMNTDNMLVSGETIDFGPCAFMNAYNPDTVFSSIDKTGRYAFGNQPQIAHWNLSCLASALLPHFHKDRERSVSIAQDAINEFRGLYQGQWLHMMRNKLGLEGEHEEDKALAEDILDLMHRHAMDYTNTFLSLQDGDFSTHEAFHSPEFQTWYMRWVQRAGNNGNSSMEEVQEKMSQYNPRVVPRNHLVEQALESAVSGDLAPFHGLLGVLKAPYISSHTTKIYQESPTPEWEGCYQTFCGT